MPWDAFISHASEDKQDVARPLADILTRAGLHVWLDENELNVGDSLREKIDHGLAGSRYGIVILSPAFFAKDWPTRELDGLTARESRSSKVILPVWHRTNQAFIAQHSPILADRIAVSTDRGIEQVALAIIKVVKPLDGQPTLDQADDRTRSLFTNPSSFVGQSIGAYDLLEDIGAGGSGIVFRASQRSSGHQVAVKLFYPLAESLASFHTSFERAFRAVASVSHPNITRVIDFGQLNLARSLTYYMAMEYVRGQSLDRWSRSISNGSDPFKRRLLVAVQLAKALNGAHETVYPDELGFEVRGVLHGDMKPANVLVSTTDQAKLLDFLLVDIQRLLDPRVVPPEYTARRREARLTAAFGTPGFMAPEQEASGLITVRTDIFGLGVTLCYLFEPKDDDWSWRSALHDKAMPRRLRDLLSAMTDHDVGARPQNMRAVLAELQAVYSAAYGGSSLSKFLDRLRLRNKVR